MGTLERRHARAVAWFLAMLAITGCEKRLSPEERRTWDARVAAVCECQRAECMDRVVSPPTLAAEYDSYAEEDRRFMDDHIARATACLDAQLRDSEARHPLD